MPNTTNSQQALIVATTPIQWQDVSSRGRPLLTKTNFNQLIRHHGVSIRYNEMNRRIDYHIPNHVLPTTGWEVSAYQYIQDLLATNDFALSKDTITNLINLTAYDNAYHPVRDAIDNTVWDGSSRLSTVLDCIQTPTPEERDIFMTRWLISAIAALYEPQFAAEGVLVLQGPQGIGKTTFFKSILPTLGAYREGQQLNPSNKDSLIQCISAWVVEIGEIGHTFRKADMDALKAHITNSEDTYRAPYGSTYVKYPRRTIYIGTVNDTTFLNDESNRRFWTLEVTGITRYADDVLQLWAELKTIYQAGHSWYLTDSERTKLAAVQQQFENTNPIEQTLQARVFADGADETLGATAILQRILPEHQRINKQEMNEAAKYLRKIGATYHKNTKKFEVRITIADQDELPRLPKLVAFKNHMK